MWERDVADEDVEFASMHASRVGRFSDDTDSVVAGGESRNLSLPASIGEFFDLGYGWVEESRPTRNRGVFGGLAHERQRNRFASAFRVG